MCLHIGSSSRAGDHRARRADRRADHAAADQHRAGRGRPAVVAGAAQVPRPAGRAVRGRHRLDPVLPRARRLDLHPPPRVDRPGLRRPAAERGVPRAHRALLHRRPGRRRPTSTAWTSTTSAGSATTRTRTRPGRSRPRRCGRRSTGLRDARDRPDHPPERHAPLPLRPVRRTGRGRVHRRRAAGAGATDVDVTPAVGRRRALERKTGAADLIDIGETGGSVELDDRRDESTTGHRRGGHVGLPVPARHEPRPAVHAQAAERALADAGLGFDDVDGYATVGYFPMYCVGHVRVPRASTRGGSTRRTSAARRSRCTSSTRPGPSRPGDCEVVLITYGSIQLSAMGRRIGGGGAGRCSATQTWDAMWGNTLVGRVRAGRHAAHGRSTARRPSSWPRSR